MIPDSIFTEFIRDCEARGLDGKAIQHELNTLREVAARSTASQTRWQSIKSFTKILKGITMKVRSVFRVVVVLAFASLAIALLAPPVVEAGGPYFSSIYASIKIVNRGYETIADSLRVGSTFTANGAISLNAALAMGQNAFLGAAVTDTVTIAGAADTDKYVILVYGAGTADTISVCLVQPTATGFVLHRTAASAEANQAYTWLKSK